MFAYCGRLRVLCIIMSTAKVSESEANQSPKGTTIVIAIIVPSVLVAVFLTLIIINRRRGFNIPRLSSYDYDDPIAKEERMQRRQDILEHHIQTQHFYDWLATQKEKHPDSMQTSDPLCAICLDEFSDDAQIRGLHCSHAFHSKCLDEWFTRYNEFCPLCHRPILPGVRLAKGPRQQRPPPLPVILMV